MTLDGHLLVDVHQHSPRRSSIKPAWHRWAHDFGDAEVLATVYPDGDLVSPAGYADLLRAEGVDIALTIAEYSPKATGIQPVEDLLPLVEHGDGLIRMIGNINPHLHFPAEDEVQRQVDLGAVAMKIHPVHGGFAANDRGLYAAYARCQELGIPVVVHCGTSSFPGSSNALAAPELLDDVLRDFRSLDVVLAHGGRGWWYDAAAFLALANEHVWIELSGLPPSRLQSYYAKHNWNRLVRRMMFGTDWPGVPGIAKNARAIAALCPDDDVVAQVLGRTAVRVYGLKEVVMSPTWTKENRPRWDDDKDRVFTDADLAAVGLADRPAVGDAIADEWWAVRDGDDVVGYGWLDSEWGDAQITFFVTAARRGTGVGGFVVDRLADEARTRGLSVIYNVVPTTHPDPTVVTAWLQARGFTDAGGGELRKRV